MNLVSWNVEDVRRCIGALPDIVEQWGRPEVVCLQELRIRARDLDAIDTLARALAGYRCHYSLPCDPRNVTFRGGRMYGVATFTRGRWRGEVPAWDREGRVVVVRKPHLAVVNVYAVNGTDKPYYDERGSVLGTRHEFKRRLQGCVFDLGRELRKSGSVIMAGDWNVSRAAIDTHPRLRTEGPHAHARAELNLRVTEGGFVDVWRERHPAERAYTWFNRRSRLLDAARVDYVLVSPDLVSRVRKVEILERSHWSDHAPVRLELRP